MLNAHSLLCGSCAKPTTRSAAADDDDDDDDASRW